MRDIGYEGIDGLPAAVRSGAADGLRDDVEVVDGEVIDLEIVDVGLKEAQPADKDGTDGEGTDGGGAESGGSTNITSGQTPPSPSNNNTNPFAFKVR